MLLARFGQIVSHTSQPPMLLFLAVVDLKNKAKQAKLVDNEIRTVYPASIILLQVLSSAHKVVGWLVGASPNASLHIVR